MLKVDKISQIQYWSSLLWSRLASSLFLSRMHTRAHCLTLHSSKRFDVDIYLELINHEHVDKVYFNSDEMVKGISPISLHNDTCMYTKNTCITLERAPTKRGFFEGNFCIWQALKAWSKVQHNVGVCIVSLIDWI